MKNEKFERAVKYIVVVAFSVIATGSIILGAAKYQNDTNEETESEKAIKDTVLKETQMVDNTLSSDKEETKEETKKSETINDDGMYEAVSGEFADFKLVNPKKGGVNEEYSEVLAKYEYLIDEYDIDDDGLNDELKFTCKSGYDKNGENVMEAAISCNGEEYYTEDKFDGNFFDDVKLIHLSDGNDFVYFDTAVYGEGWISSRRFVSLQDYKVALTEVDLPHMDKASDDMFKSMEENVLTMVFKDELMYTGWIPLCYEISYKNGTFVTDSEKIKVIHEDEYKNFFDDDNANMVLMKYVLDKPMDFYSNNDKSGEKIRIDKGEEIDFEDISWNKKDHVIAMEIKSDEVANSFYDLYHFVTKDGKDLYMDPVESNKKNGDGYENNEPVFKGVEFVE
ncbi:hypothetical protein SAMN02745111_01378 [Eubacterium uniforme]|uniref:Uncharacterized protein n=1 Tax=Eubacterium uniforme TaxID=39495 RepID=A0A1T4VPY9_9FIRM|nr:hypothetical protein [Eubacterium uniforme]SKA67043.1 hypothetical protein SAMN02745111_01378 [Eubacterium uniforme]